MLEAVDSVEELRAALEDPDGFLLVLGEAATPAGVRAADPLRGFASSAPTLTLLVAPCPPAPTLTLPYFLRARYSGDANYVPLGFYQPPRGTYSHKKRFLSGNVENMRFARR